MAINKQDFCGYIKQFNFRELFNEMGWNNDKTKQAIVVDGITFTLQAIAEKSGFKILFCNPNEKGLIPDYNIRKKIETKVTKLFQEHLIIFADVKNQEQIWQLVVRQSGKPTKVTETHYNISQDPELLYQRASGIFFEMDEEEKITIVDVKSRMTENFHANAEKLTKAFYDKFKKEHSLFLSFIKGINDKVNQEWYASLMLNRLMFCYFIQKKGFLDNNKNYLREKLKASQEKKGKNNFYSFYRDFLLVLFHQGLNEAQQKDEVKIEIGRIPYLNGGLFDEHELEKLYKNIDIEDEAFERVFNFFDQYEWHLDTRITASGKDINPDVIGYIFEKYINDRSNMGAYYTKEDITDYISKNCILPYLFDETKRKCSKVFLPDGEIWQDVKQSDDKYIYEAIKKGVDLPLPEEIAIGLDTAKPNLLERRKEWNKAAPSEYSLPTEIWREVVDRRNRYAEIKNKISKGEITAINDFITYNLNIRQFAQDVVENTTDPEFLKHFYKALNNVTIIDPTCGSGAFLFAAMNILEQLYEACIQRMRAFVQDEDRNNEANKISFNNKYKFFRSVLEDIQNEYHPNQKYFIYKSIILRNLYGVDIMNEAVEIAKLRLFLKLVATVDVDYRKPNLGLEPLPDIDFNIRAGNTLVGFASLNEAIQAINEKDKKGQMGLVFEDELDIVNSIKIKSDDLALVFKSFKNAQLQENLSEHKKAKEQLLKYQVNLNNILNEYLAFTYGIDIVKSKDKYQQFLQTHQPFHWFAEFYEIIHNKGGFDVVIGNPPYVEYSKVRKIYKINDYKTEKCGNLYAFVFERCFKISKNVTGLIIQLSAISTETMKPLQEYLKDNFKNIYSSCFPERPKQLFDGACIALTIQLCFKLGNEKEIHSGGINRIAEKSREYLFQNITYTKINNEFIPKQHLFPKFKFKIEKSIFSKIFKEKQLLNYISNHISLNNTIFYRTAGGRYWKIFLNRNFKNESTSNKAKIFDKQYDKNAIVAVLNSNLFWWYFANYFDLYNLKDYMIFSFPFSFKNGVEEISKLGIKLMNSFERNVETKVQYIKSKSQTAYFETFNPALSKDIIDEIDTVLAEHYGFTDEELDFIINYDIKYRMGKELESGE